MGGSANGLEVVVAQDHATANGLDISGTRDDGTTNDPVGDSIPKENVKSVNKELCGSLDQWLNNLAPFGVELEFPPHLAAIYDKHTKTYVVELKGALNSFGKVLQTIHCKRTEQLLLDVHAASRSSPPESDEQNDVIFDIPIARGDGVGKVGERGCSKDG
ncbi:hypothetical protein VPH35_121788 [Triticum aestivum]